MKKTQHYVKEEGGKRKLVDAPAVVEGMTLDDVNSAMKAARAGKKRKEIVRLTRLSQKIRAKARSGGEGDPECSHQVCVHCLMDSISPGGGDGYVLPQFFYIDVWSRVQGRRPCIANCLSRY